MKRSLPRLTDKEVEAPIYVKCFMEAAHLERGDLGAELGEMAQVGMTVVEKLLAAYVYKVPK